MHHKLHFFSWSLCPDMIFFCLPHMFVQSSRDCSECSDFGAFKVSIKFGQSALELFVLKPLKARWWTISSMIRTARCHGTRRLGSQLCVFARVGVLLSWSAWPVSWNIRETTQPQLSCSCVVTTHTMATALAHFGWKMEGHRSAFLGFQEACRDEIGKSVGRCINSK